GSVGIGATAPAGLLEIKGSAASTKIKFGGTGGDAHHLSSARDMVFNAEISDNNPAFLFRSSTYDDLSSLTELMAILGNGNVGIGTTSPEGALDINKGRAEAQANATNGALAYGSEKADLVLTRRHSATKSLNGYPASLIDFRATNVSQEWSVAQILGVVDQNISGGHAGGLAILTSPGGSTDAAGRRNTSAAPITRMVVDANGNVGVGT
ncbi:MAG: hypothetical protein GY803_10060, partial [Chloroflexi bacterium]|nr:hypothetical protein [Chloroflexota bacterium]